MVMSDSDSRFKSIDTFLGLRLWLFKKAIVYFNLLRFRFISLIIFIDFMLCILCFIKIKNKPLL